MRRLFCAILIAFLMGSMGLGFSNQFVKAGPIYNTVDNPDSDPSIYILPDGSITPEGVPIQRDGNLYTFTGDILTNTLINGNLYNGIIIEKDNIVIDGAKHILDGQDRSLLNNGITLEGRENVTIRNLVIRHFAPLCILLSLSSNNFIIGNDIASSSRYGGDVALVSSSNNIISGNNITDSYQYCDGISLSSSSNSNSIIGNNIQGHQPNQAGVGIYDSFNNIVRGNNITDNHWGISIYSADSNSVYENKISSNSEYGVNVQDSDYNKIYHNELTDSGMLVYSSNSINVWDDGYPSGGNYWSDYKGTDGNGDGIGDTPHIIDDKNQDSYPLIGPWSAMYLVDSFEGGSLSRWSGTSVTSGETASIYTARTHHGAYSARFTSNGGGGYERTYCYANVASSSELYARSYVYVSTSGIAQTNDRFFFLTFQSGSNTLAYGGWRSTTAGTRWCLTTRQGTSYVDVYSSAAPSTGRWYCVELHWKKSATDGLAELWVRWSSRLLDNSQKHRCIWGCYSSTGRTA